MAVLCAMLVLLVLIHLVLRSLRLSVVLFGRFPHVSRLKVDSGPEFDSRLRCLRLRSTGKLDFLGTVDPRILDIIFLRAPGLCSHCWCLLRHRCTGKLGSSWRRLQAWSRCLRWKSEMFLRTLVCAAACSVLCCPRSSGKCDVSWYSAPCLARQWLRACSTLSWPSHFHNHEEYPVPQSRRVQPPTLHSKRHFQDQEQSAAWYVGCGTLFLRQTEGCY